MKFRNVECNLETVFSRRAFGGDQPVEKNSSERPGDGWGGVGKGGKAKT